MDFHKTTSHYAAWADFKVSRCVATVNGLQLTCLHSQKAGGVVSQVASKTEAIDFQG